MESGLARSHLGDTHAGLTWAKTNRQKAMSGWQVVLYEFVAAMDGQDSD